MFSHLDLESEHTVRPHQTELFFACLRIDQRVTFSVLLESDRTFTIKLGLSQSLMIHEGTHNPNVTLNSSPKKFWGLFGQKAYKTQQITLSHPQNGGLSLT